MKEVEKFSGVVNGNHYTSKEEYNKAIQAAIDAGEGYSCGYTIQKEVVQDSENIGAEKTPCGAPYDKKPIYSGIPVQLVNRFYQDGILPLNHEQIDEISADTEKTTKYILSLENFKDWKTFRQDVSTKYTPEEIDHYQKFIECEMDRIRKNIDDTECVAKSIAEKRDLINGTISSHMRNYDQINMEIVELRSKLHILNKDKEELENKIARAEEHLRKYDEKNKIINNARSLLNVDLNFSGEVLDNLDRMDRTPQGHQEKNEENTGRGANESHDGGWMELLHEIGII